MTSPSIQAEVLGRLLLLPSMLEVLPNTSSIAAFLNAALCEIPGISNILMCAKGEVYSPNDSSYCSNCPNLTTNRGSKLSLCPLIEDENEEKIKTIPLANLRHSYGYLMIEIDEPEIFAIYEPHVRNIANIVATVLENRHLIDKMQATNEDLEERVEARTKELKQEILLREEVDAELRASQKKLVEAQYIARLGDFTWDLATDTVTWSEGTFKLLKYDPNEIIDYQKVNNQIHHPDDLERVTKWLTDSIASGKEILTPNEYRLICKDGEVIYVETKGRIEYQGGKSVKVFGICQDITQRKETEQKLELAARVFTHAREGIFITDSDCKILQVNEAFTQITGYSREEVLGKIPPILNSDLHDLEFYRAFWFDLQQKGYWQGEIWCRDKKNNLSALMLTISTVYDFDGKIHNYVALFSDITEQKHYQQHIEYLAHYDALTNLPNRVLLGNRLRQGMVLSQRHGRVLAVAYIDLDGFKTINDTHGHEVGDQVLIILANRMKKVLRESDTISRLGGDEFVAVVIDLVDMNVGLQILTRLLDTVSQPLQIGNFNLEVSASLGVTFYPQSENIDADQLLRQADQAMYEAKLAGKNRYALYKGAKVL